MKKLISAFLCTIALTTAATLNACAQGQDTDTATSASTSPSPAVSASPSPTPSASPSPAPTAAPTAAPVSGNQKVEITPDHPLYTLKKLIESIRVVLSFSDDKKAQLYVSLANERLAEAEIMSEKNKRELVESVLKAYVKTVKNANEKAEEAIKKGKPVTSVLDDIRIVELNADRIVIKATGDMSQEAAQEIVTAVTEQVKKTLAIQTMQIAKSNLSEAKEEVQQAREELKTARDSGDEAEIKAAQENLEKAEQAKQVAEQQKKDVEAYKEQLIQEKKEQDRNEKDEDKNPDFQGKKQGKREEIAKKLLEKEKEKLERKEDKITEKYWKAKDRIEKNDSIKHCKSDDGEDD